jgi:hypothetical protein
MDTITIDKPRIHSGGRKKGQTAGNLPSFACRWTISKASAEFQMAQETVSKRLRELNYPAGPDGCWSTMQMAACKYGDLNLERARKVRAEANLAERADALDKKHLVTVEFMLQRLADGAVAIKNLVKASGLSKKEKMELLNEIADYFDANGKTKLGELAED